MAIDPERAVATSSRREAGPREIGLVVLGALLLLLLVWFFFLRSDGEEVGTSAPAPVEVEEDTDEEVESTSPGKKSPVETFEVFAPKDPFDPLISASTGADVQTTGDATTAATGGTTVAADGTGTTEDGTTTTGSGGTTTRTTTGGGDGSSDVGGHRVRVIEVFREGGRDRAQVQVDGTVYTVDEGERFAENFQLMSTSGQCATMLYGDDEFTLCEGEEILK